MNEQHTELEEAIRERLDQSSSDVPDVAAMRERVLAALEMQNAVHPTHRSAFRARSRRTAAALVGLAAGIAAMAILLAQQTPNTVIATGGPPTDRADAAVESATPRIVLSEVRDSLAVTQPSEEAGAWAVRTEDDQLLTLEFVPTEVGPEHASQYLRIITLPPGTTADDVVDSITSSLFDTVVIGDTASRIGGQESRALRLTTVGGTTHLGFRIVDDIYLETEGTARVFVVHITGSPPDTMVYWIEASPEDIDALEEIASRFIETLNGG